MIYITYSFIGFWRLDNTQTESLFLICYNRMDHCSSFISAQKFAALKLYFSPHLTFVAKSLVRQISETILLPRSPSLWSEWSWFFTRCHNLVPLSRSGVIIGVRDLKLSGLLAVLSILSIEISEQNRHSKHQNTLYRE